MSVRTRLTALGLTAALGLASACGVSETEVASDYPTRTIDVVVPFPPGGGSDVLARALVDAVNASGDLEEKMQIVNREGGAAVLGVSEVLTAKPDGYTVAMAPEGPITMQPQLGGVSYDPLEMSPVVQLTRGPMMIVVPADSPFQTLDDLVEAARQNPGDVSLGEGPLSYAIAAAQIEQHEDVTFRKVKYEGDAATTTAVLGGNVDATFSQPSSSLSQVRSGALRVLVIGGDERSEFLPDVPTFKESGLDMEVVAAYGVFGPAGLPDEIVEVLEDAFLAAMKTDEFQAVADTSGLPVEAGDGQTLMDYYTERTDEVAAIIKKAGGSL